MAPAAETNPAFAPQTLCATGVLSAFAALGIMMQSTVCWWGHQHEGERTSKTRLDPESTCPRVT